MNKYSDSYPHDFFIVLKPREVRRVIDLVNEKEKSLREITRSYWEAQNLTKNSSLVLIHESILKEIEGAKCIYYPLNPEDEEAFFFALLNCASFIVDASRNEESARLNIYISPNDLLSFRIASFAMSVWNKMAKKVEMLDYEGNAILPLYAPRIRDVTQTVLFSLIDFRNQYGQDPDFEALRNYNFEILNQRGLMHRDGSYRRWSSADDRRYVSTLYASLKQLRNLKLIIEKREVIKNRERIISIKPTLNGLLSILFSDLVDLVLESMSPLTEEE